MTSTTPRTLRNANYIVYTACAIGMAGLASVGLAMAMREDPPLKPTAVVDPIKKKAPRSTESPNQEERSRAARSSAETPERKLPSSPEPAPPIAIKPFTPKVATSEAQTRVVATPDNSAPSRLPPTAPATPPPTEPKPEKPQPPSYAPATASQRAEILAVIERGDLAERKALRTLDLSTLKSTHAGKAYNMIRDAVASLKKEGFYVASEYAGAKVETVKVSADGQKAQVRTTETWESSWYNSQTNVCKAHVHRRPVPQTIFLTLAKQSWVISDVKHDNHDALPFVACHKN